MAAGLSSHAWPLPFADPRGFAAGVQDPRQTDRQRALKASAPACHSCLWTVGQPGPRGCSPSGDQGWAWQGQGCYLPWAAPRRPVASPRAPGPSLGLPCPGSSGAESQGQGGQPPAGGLWHGWCPLEPKASRPGRFGVREPGVRNNACPTQLGFAWRGGHRRSC